MRNAKIKQRNRLYIGSGRMYANTRMNIDKIYQYAAGILPKINHVFANYTGHGIRHSVSVMDYMYDLILDISEISDLEIAYLIDTALLYNVGMAVNSVESGRYIEYAEKIGRGSANEKVKELYWHGISLDRGRIDLGIREVAENAAGKQSNGI